MNLTLLCKNMKGKISKIKRTKLPYVGGGDFLASLDLHFFPYDTPYARGVNQHLENSI